MMKFKSMFLKCFILIIFLFFAGCEATERYNEVDVKTIETLKDILIQNINNNEIEEILGREVFFENYETKDDVINNVEQIWIEIYGKETMLNEKPYLITYDADANCWFITGSLPESDDPYIEIVGGVAFAAVSNENGELLIIGHFE